MRKISLFVLFSMLSIFLFTACKSNKKAENKNSKKNMVTIFIHHYHSNLKKKSGFISMKAWLSFPATNLALKKELTDKTKIIIKKINAYFAAHTYAQLKYPKKTIVLNDLIKNKVNQLLKSGKVTHVALFEFLLFKND